METIIGVIFIGLLIGAFAAALVRPWLAFVLIVAFPVIEQALQGYFPFFVTYRTLFNYMVAGTVAMTLLIRFLREPTMLAGSLNPVAKMCILLVILSFTSLLWTPNSESGLDHTVGKFQYTLLFMVMAPLLISSLDDFRRLRIPLIIIAVTSLLFIVVGPNAKFYGTRLALNLSSTERGNTLVVAELGALALIFGVLTTQRGVGKLVVPLQFAAAFFGFGVGLLSGSRGQVMAGVLMAFLFFPLARKVKNAMGYFGIGMGVVVVGGLLYLSVQLFVTSDNVERWSFYSLTSGITGRMEIVTGALEPWLRDPLSWFFGRGAGAFVTTGLVHRYPHNFAIEALTELGIVGFSIYVLIIVFTCKSFLGIFRMYRNDPDMRSSIAVLGATALFFLMISLKQGTVHSPGAVMIWYLVIGRIYWYEQRQLELQQEAEIDPETGLAYDYEEDAEDAEDDEYEKYEDYEDAENPPPHPGSDGLSPA